MPHQYALNRAFVRRLQESLPANLDRYGESDSWVEDYAGTTQWEFPTPCEPASPLDMLMPEKGNHHDLENCIRLHKSFPGLSPLQARDSRLWTRLTHVELWKYMRARWPVEKHLPDREKSQRFTLSHYFVAQTQSRALLRNGAARLWWTAKMTYDPTRENPYELTAVLLSSLDIAKNLFERNLGRIPSLSRVFLDYLLRNKAECLDNGDSSRRLVRRLSKAMNLRGGVCVLDCMKSQEIVAFLEQEKARVLQAGNVPQEGEDGETIDEDDEL
jgi:hypothetical protein